MRIVLDTNVLISAYLVSGDDDLLSLAIFEGIEIVNATTILKMINKQA